MSTPQENLFYCRKVSKELMLLLKSVSVSPKCSDDLAVSLEELVVSLRSVTETIDAGWEEKPRVQHRRIVVLPPDELWSFGR